MEVRDAINQRVSLRVFDQKPISEDDINIIVESAMRAPTAGNMMLYSMIKITSKDTLEKLSVSCDNQPFIKRSPLAIIFVLDYEKWFDYYRINGVEDFAKETGLQFNGPTTADFLLAMQDATIAAQNAVLAAEDLGIGSCYIGDIMEQYEFHKELLNLPDYTFPALMLVFGYYPKEYKRNQVGRFDKKFVLFEEKYQKLDESQIKEMFGQLDQRFKGSKDAQNYAQMHYKRKTGADFSIEMERSVKKALEVFTNKLPR